ASRVPLPLLDALPIGRRRGWPEARTPALGGPAMRLRAFAMDHASFSLRVLGSPHFEQRRVVDESSFPGSRCAGRPGGGSFPAGRSEEHTSELQSRENL